MTGPFVLQILSIEADEYQTLSLQVSDAGGLEQATAYISLPTLHSTTTETSTSIEWYFTLDLPNTKRFYKQKRKQLQKGNPLYIN